MPMPRPSLRDLVARLEAEIESRLPALDARLRHSYVGVLAKSIAGAHHEMYGYLAWVEAQAFPDQAELESLERWAVIWGVARHPAVAATGNVSVTGSAGARVPSGTIWLRSDGVEYRVTTATDVGAGATDVPVTSVTPGRIGNVAAGRATLRSPILGVVSRGVVEATGGADAEGDVALRDRLLLRIRTPPSSGTSADYERWAREAHAAVTRVWARPATPAPGTVTVYLMTDGEGNGIPAAGVVTAVVDYLAPRRPLAASVVVSAPAPVALDVTIAGISPDVASVRAAVEAAIADLVRRESEPGGTILVSRLREAISGAAGEADHRLVAPVRDVTHTAGQIAVPGAITWS